MVLTNDGPAQQCKSIQDYSSLFNVGWWTDISLKDFHGSLRIL